MPAQRVGQHRALAHQQIASPVQHYDRLLIDALGRNKTHGWTGDRLADGFAEALLKLNLVPCHRRNPSDLHVHATYQIRAAQESRQTGSLLVADKGADILAKIKPARAALDEAEQHALLKVYPA